MAVVRQHGVVYLLDATGCLGNADVPVRLRLELVRVAQVGVPRAAVVPADLVVLAGLPRQDFLDTGNAGRRDGFAADAKKSRAGARLRRIESAAEAAKRQSGTISSACGPFWPWVMRNSTF